MNRGRWAAAGAHRPRRLAALIWLGFIAIPIVDAITSHEGTAGRVLSLCAAVAFVAAYIWLVAIMFDDRRPRLAWSLVAVLLALATALTVIGRPDWAFLFSYCAACIAILAPSRLALPAVIACAVAGAGLGALSGASGSAVLNIAITSLGVGLLLVVLGDLRRRNRELTQARAELADAAVAAERARFARDLHDLLGHSLSVIALKAELAGRLLRERPDAAADELAEVEAVARQALGEVRDAVSGYRRPTLDDELAGARMALLAAGIGARVERAPLDGLDPDSEAVLAWTVREGATNVIRHAAASHCLLRVAAGGDEWQVEILDDGTGRGAAAGVDGSDAGGGHGLQGLGERAQRLGGTVQAGPRPDGPGFRLTAAVPVRGEVRAP